MQRPRHPLPKRPGAAPSSSQPSAPSQPTQSWTPNASGGYGYNASGGYPGYGTGAYGYGGYNASGGYPGYAAPTNASGGYPSYASGYAGYNASGGYPGYAAQAAYANPYAASTSGSTSTSAPGGGPRRNAPAGRNRRNCSQVGCNFSGTPDAVTTHEADRHLIGVKAPVRSEEEERWAKSGKVAYIQGTGLKLDTPEEIAAWIAERKKKFPTAARVAERVSFVGWGLGWVWGVG